MSDILHRSVTPAMFAEFCRKAPGRPHARFPAAWVRAFCEAVDSDELVKCLLPESTRRSLSLSAGIIKSREALAHAQEALGQVQADLAKLAEGKRQKTKPRKA